MFNNKEIIDINLILTVCLKMHNSFNGHFHGLSELVGGPPKGHPSNIWI